MSLRRNAVVQVVFALLLLCAQQGALTHEIWHFAKAGPQAGFVGDHKGSESKKNRLCDLHSALGTVLGAVATIASPAPLDSCTEFSFLAAASRAASVSLLAPFSRGPPALS
jgi:hypothetical protein